MTAPSEPALVVDVGEVARRAGLAPDDDNVVAAVTDAIRDATADAEAYLGYPLVPLSRTETGLEPGWDGTWPLGEDPVASIVQVTAELDAHLQPTGLYTVEYLWGRDSREPEYGPIRRWITASAAYAHPSVRLLADAGGQRRRVKSVSAEGQSVSYESSPPTAGAPTAGVPPMSTMDRWRLAGRRVYTRPGWTVPRPY
ncbi:hypothetical protein OOJ91_33795 [Micromonospora lupini]|uniref:hypothetical protein n=1 Tax=Micromonospora lupini TaxID=285679 RepID=UPI0022557B5C|nr:hypothetical protein [Micromonospora lupini]MCX5070821.1 hypothetical protein [Micromonospora lupini]